MAANMDDNELYDRQIRLWGVEAQRRMQQSKVLIHGMGGLGSEIVKNLVLAGFNATVADSRPVAADDLASNFFVDSEDFGKNRAMASLGNIRELNQFASVEALDVDISSISREILSAHTLLVVTDAPLSEQLRLDELCRECSVAFYAAKAFGDKGILFCDLVTHTFRDESGSGSDSKLSEPVTLEYLSLREALTTPLSSLTDRKGTVSRVFVMNRVVEEFEQEHGRRVQPADAPSLLAMTEKVIAEEKLREGKKPIDLTETHVQALAATAHAELAPVCAILGGIIGQEIVKYISEKGEPIDNFFVLETYRGDGRAFRLPKKAPKPVKKIDQVEEDLMVCL